MTGPRSSNTDAFPLMTGESACSFALRLANFLTVRPDGFLRTFLGDARNLASAVHLHGKTDFLSDASGLDRQAIAASFIRPSSDLTGERILLDFTVAEHHIDQTTRRVSPAAFARDVEASKAPYHRLVWSVRELRFDPETGSALISACDHCGRTLTWEDCFDPASCGRCGRELWRAKTPEETMTPYDALVCDLFHRDPQVRSDRRSRLAPPLIGWSEGDLLDLMNTLRRVQRIFQIPSMGPNVQAVDPRIIEASSSISGFLNGPLRAAAQSSERTAITVAAAATTSALMAAPRPVANFLTSLMVSRT
jgi:hypothetical protein